MCRVIFASCGLVLALLGCWSVLAANCEECQCQDTADCVGNTVEYEVNDPMPGYHRTGQACHLWKTGLAVFCEALNDCGPVPPLNEEWTASVSPNCLSSEPWVVSSLVTTYVLFKTDLNSTACKQGGMH